VETTLPQFGRLVKAPAFVAMHRRYGVTFRLCKVREASRLLHPLRALTKELLVRRTMSGVEVDAMIAAAVAAKAAADERQRRLDWKRIEQSAVLFVADEQE
jgi:hypothetical protein